MCLYSRQISKKEESDLGAGTEMKAVLLQRRGLCCSLFGRFVPGKS